MEKYDFERFGISPRGSEQFFIVSVGNSEFKVLYSELMSFITICVGSGLDLLICSNDNQFLTR